MDQSICKYCGCISYDGKAHKN